MTAPEDRSGLVDLIAGLRADDLALVRCLVSRLLGSQGQHPEPAFSGLIPSPQDRLLRMKELRQKVGLSEVTIRDYMKGKIFPQALSIPGKRGVRWSELEVDAWIRARLTERDRAAV